MPVWAALAPCQKLKFWIVTLSACVVTQASRVVTCRVWPLGLSKIRTWRLLSSENCPLAGVAPDAISVRGLPSMNTCSGRLQFGVALAHTPWLAVLNDGTVRDETNMPPVEFQAVQTSLAKSAAVPWPSSVNGLLMTTDSKKLQGGTNNPEPLGAL